MYTDPVGSIDDEDVESRINTRQKKDVLADLYREIGWDRTLTSVEKRRFRKRIWKFMWKLK